MPSWLVPLAVIVLVIDFAAALLVLADVLAGPRQKMWIMNVVWPLTALWAGPVGAWAYFRYGRGDAPKRQPFPVQVAKGTTHCGSGCALGDVVAELVFMIAPITLFGRHIFGAWIYDFAAAFFLGIVFQYFTIKPMRNVSVAAGVRAALKADTLSLTAWQLGMYGWMAIATFALFHHELRPSSAVFWLMMQIGMFAGFVTSYPVNWVLLRRHLKEAM